MKIAIIGSGGQLGTDCTEIFSVDHKIFGFDIPQIDIGDLKSIEDNLTPIKPDVIINCAAFTNVDACETEKELAWKINAKGPEHLATTAATLGAKLIHVSTDYVFSGNKPIPEFYTENDQVDPLSQYGSSKLAGEQAVEKILPDSLILRTAWLYSGYGKNFLKTMLRMALSDPKRAFSIVNDQYGSLTWSYTLAKQIEVLLESDLSGVMHTTAEGYSTWYEAACYFLEKMDVPHSFVPCKTEDYPTPAHRPVNSILENQVLKNKDLSVFIDWKADLDIYVDRFKKPLIEETEKALAENN